MRDTSACNEGDLRSTPGLGRSPGKGDANPLQCSYLENSMDKRSLASYSPWGPKKLHTSEQLTLSVSFILYKEKRTKNKNKKALQVWTKLLFI